ncbi:hypothetical protein GCM10010531_28410 [Blastococcus jejuensis]|uniref:Uncharacterized protein n=1 Tax=Blastococcus jejuensis TaxID=351224 RepID=A0ABP6PAW9_9ACTN
MARPGGTGPPPDPGSAASATAFSQHRCRCGTALPEGIPMNDIRDIVCKGLVIGGVIGSLPGSVLTAAVRS